jgi:integrase/recombinase XerD
MWFDIVNIERRINNCYPIYEIFDAYKKRTALQPGKNRYTRYAKKFMIFCVERNLKVSQLAIEAFIEKEKITAPSIIKILNFFIDFCTQHNIVEFDNQIRFKGEHILVLKYLAQNDFRNLKTKVNYQNNINAFLRYLLEKEESFTSKTVKRYLAEGISRGLSLFTINTVLASIKSFTNWLLKDLKLMEQIRVSRKKEFIKILAIKRYKLPPNLCWKDSLSKDQCSELLKKMTNFKHKLAFSFQISEGLRASEVCNLKLKDIDFGKNTIKVIGKGYYTPKEIWLLPQTKQVLIEYLMRNKIGKENKLFDKMSYQNLYKLLDTQYLKPLARENKLKLSLHSLRHTAAQLMVERGLDNEYIQRQLRHVDIETTIIYIKKYVYVTFLKEMPLDISNGILLKKK